MRKPMMLIEDEPTDDCIAPWPVLRDPRNGFKEQGGPGDTIQCMDGRTLPWEEWHANLRAWAREVKERHNATYGPERRWFYDTWL